ncbi:MAG: LapA family protein [Treponemataceae bacterium]|nr:LapA family protein [Treponemataceae bacterium]
MPWRLVRWVAFIGVLVLFIVFNMGNLCTISFGLVTLREVPVYLLVLISFGLGMAAALPSVFAAWALVKYQNSQKAPKGRLSKKRGGGRGEISTVAREGDAPYDGGDRRGEDDPLRSYGID